MRILPVLLLMIFGCDGPTNNVIQDLSFAPPRDLSMKAGGGSLTVTGDAPSGYTPGVTITVFTCTTDPSFGATVNATLPNNFPAGSPEAGDTLTLQIFDTGMWVVGGPPLGNIYYQKNGLTNDAAAQTGTINNVVLAGQGSSPGNLTANGGWQCP